MPEHLLDHIVATTRADLAERQARTPLDALRALVADAPELRQRILFLTPRIDRPAHLIAEIKRASPSKGVITDNFDPVAQALAYQHGGASVISVLTEPHFFLGSLDHLRVVRDAADLPILRKDFILDPYQVYESRAAGADAVLLICALLDDAELTNLLALTHSLGMEALVEAHDEAEVRRAVAVGARIIGVNSRDLHTFDVDTDIVRHLRPLVPAVTTFVAESGIATAIDAARARAWGADAILVGEALMRAAGPAAKARELSSAPGGPIHGFFYRTHTPFVKICGLTRTEGIALADELGADAYGLVFAPMAPDHRRLTPDAACHLTGKGDYAMSHDSDDTYNLHAAKRAQPGEIKTIGVFVNEDMREIGRIVEHVGLDAIQLSGDETPEQCAEVADFAQRPVLKALRLREEADLAQLDAYAMAGAVLLLDAHVPGSYGGSGVTGDWDLARPRLPALACHPFWRPHPRKCRGSHRHGAATRRGCQQRRRDQQSQRPRKDTRLGRCCQSRDHQYERIATCQPFPSPRRRASRPRGR